MQDKIFYRKIKVRQNEIRHEFVLLFDNRSPFVLSAESLADLMSLYDAFMSPIGSRFETLSDYQTSFILSQEDTLIIKAS